MSVTSRGVTWLLYGTLAATVVTALVMFAGAGLRACFGRLRRGWLRRIGIALAVALPVHALLTVPAALALIGLSFVGTRGDERGYAGPRIRSDGSWLQQSRETLRAERTDPAALPDDIDVLPPVHFEAADGTPLRAFVVPPRPQSGGGGPRATVVMVHGLFRGALELEPVGSMFRDLGCEVVLLELRNHGGSGRATPSFGLRESTDVLAALRWARARSPADAARPAVLFGVSLGTAAVALAAPQVADLGGVVLDAPMDDARSTAERMLAAAPAGRPRRLSVPEPFRSVLLFSIGLFAGAPLADIEPAKALTSLPAEVPVLLIAAGDDRRMPPESVRAIFASLPQRDDRKSLWIRDGAEHGHVWTLDPQGYRERLAAFLDDVNGR